MPDELLGPSLIDESLRKAAKRPLCLRHCTRNGVLVLRAALPSLHSDDILVYY